MAVLEEEFNRVELADGCGAFFDPVSRIFRLISRRSLYAFRITPRTNLIEHLYWGTRLAESDELSFLALNSVLMKSPFDPTSQVIAEGVRDTAVATVPSSDLWKAVSRGARSQGAGLGVDQRRLENLSWRQWVKETKQPECGGGREDTFPSSPREATLLLSPSRLSLSTAEFTTPSAAMLRSPSRALMSPRASPMPQPDTETQEILSKNSLLLEFSDAGTGDYRSPSVRATARMSDITPLEYHAHRLIRGKAPVQEGIESWLPGVRCESESDCATIIVTMRDKVTGLEVDLIYSVFAEFDIIVRKIEYRNTCTGSDLVLEKAVGCTVDFDGGSYTLTRLTGSWAREAQRTSHRIQPGIFQISSTRGTSSHMHNPVAVVSSRDYSETSGSHWGFVMAYSGSFLIEVENSETGRVRVNCGFNPLNFKWKLLPGESVASPEVLLSYSDCGAGDLSRNFHKIINERLIPSVWRGLRAPVLVNTWEAMYFNVTHQKVIELGKYAATIGAEVICIDDGWFRGRDDDTSGLGDWEVDEIKIPFGLDHLCNELNAMGLKFGLWIEPEMVSPTSDFFQRNPKSILFAPGRARSLRRNQYILDFTQAEVRDAMLGKLRKLLGSCNVEYVKWDMNRHLTEPNSVALLQQGRLQGEVMHRHMLGVYEVLGRITSEFPNVRFETCAGGGGRFDCGMLFFSPQIWASDNTDAACRARIQSGLSLVYPVNVMASHITESPNHQTGRVLPLSARTIVALFGAFGVELDLMNLSVQQIEDLKLAVEKYKCIMDKIASSRPKLYRLWDPFDSESATVYGAEVFAWMLVTEDQSLAIVAAGMLRLMEVGKIVPKLQMQGIDPNKNYRVKDLLSSRHVRDAMTLKVTELPGAPVPRFKPLILPGRTLINAGIPLQFLLDGDFVLLELSQTRF
jgi:alpha-galactosidase